MERKTLIILLSAMCATFIAVTLSWSSHALAKRYGGNLKVIAWGGSPRNLSHVGKVDTPNDWMYARGAAETLIYVDNEGVYHPRLAKKWEVSPDGKSIIFHLHGGVMFHDGTPCDAQAVKESLDVARMGEMGGSLRTIESIEVLNSHTVRINLKHWDWAVLDALAGTSHCRIISPTSLKTKSDEWLFTHIVGTGPFELVEYKRDVELRFKKFDKYWQKGKPYLDGYTVLLMADYTTALMAFKAGEGHVMGVQPKDVASLKEEGYDLEIGPQGATIVWYFDSANPDSPFHDVRVRKAFCYAIDEQELAKVGYGYYVPVNQPYPPGNLWHNPLVKGYPYNPDKAKKLLAAAGYPKGFKTKLIIVAGGEKDTVIAMQDMLKRVGIDAEIVELTLPRFSETVAVTGWNGVVRGITGVVPSHPARGERYSNLTFGATWKSVMRQPELEELFLKASKERDPNKAKEMFHELYQLMVDKYCHAFFAYFSPQILALRKGVQNLGIELQWWTLENAWLER